MDTSSLAEAEETGFPTQECLPPSTALPKMGHRMTRPKRRATPAARRVSFNEGEPPNEDLEQTVPRDALSAMRLLAQMPGATNDTRMLLTQLEAHLAATSAAAELDEPPPPSLAEPTPDPLTGSRGKWLRIWDSFPGMVIDDSL